jgi:hypothetical protein
MPIWKEHMTCKCNFSCCYKGFFSKSYSFIHGDKHMSPKVSALLCYVVCHFTVPESHFCLSVHRLIIVLFPSLSSYFLPACCCVFLSFICLRPRNKTVYFFFTVSVTVPSVYIFFVSSFLILYFIDNSILLT